MFNRSFLVLVLVGFVAVLLGMILNERIMAPSVRSAAEETAREEMRAGVDSDTAVVGVKATNEKVREMCRKAAISGTNIMPTDEFVLLCLEGIEKDGSISKDRIASMREDAKREKEERLKKSAKPSTIEPPADSSAPAPDPALRRIVPQIPDPPAPAP